MKTIKLIKVFSFFGASIFALTSNKSLAGNRDFTVDKLTQMRDQEQINAKAAANNDGVKTRVENLNTKISSIERQLIELERSGNQNTSGYSQLQQEKTGLENEIATIRENQRNKVYYHIIAAKDLQRGVDLSSAAGERELLKNREETRAGLERSALKLNSGVQAISQNYEPWSEDALKDAVDGVLANKSNSIGDIHRLPDRNMRTSLSESSINTLISLEIYPEEYMQILGTRAEFNTLFLDSLPTKEAEAEPYPIKGQRLFNDAGIKSLEKLPEANLILIKTGAGFKININYVVEVVNKFAVGHKLNISEASVFGFVTNRIFLFSGLINFFRISIAHKQKSRLDELITRDLIKLVDTEKDRLTFLALIESDAKFGIYDFTPPRSLIQLRMIASNIDDFKARVMEYLFESVDTYKIEDVYKRALLAKSTGTIIENQAKNDKLDIENLVAFVKETKKAFWKASGLEESKTGFQALKKYPVYTAVEAFQNKRRKASSEVANKMVFGNVVASLLNTSPINSCYLYYK